MADGDLCEVDDVLAWLPSQPGQAASILARLITAASKFVCNYTGRGTFAAQGYTDTYDGTGKPWMLLRQWPVVSVQSVTLGLDVQTVLSGAAAFALEQPLPAGGNQRLTLLGCASFPRGRSNVQVAYTAGYATIPFDVAQACIELVGEAYLRRNRIGQNSVSMKDQSVVSFSQKDMNDAIRSMLNPYRRLVPC